MVMERSLVTCKPFISSRIITWTITTDEEITYGQAAYYPFHSTPELTFNTDRIKVIEV